MNINLERLRTFSVVARTGTLSAAAIELGATQPNVGRHMVALEKEVGIDLFVRHSRGIHLTPQGKEFLELCEDVEGQITQGAKVIREKNLEPTGTLKIGTGIGTADEILENIFEFTKKFPKIGLSFLSTTNIYDFKSGETDVGITPVLYSDPSLTQHHLFTSTLKIYAAPRYIEIYGIPKSLEELKNHKLISYVYDNDMINKEIDIYLKDIEYNSTILFKINNGISLKKALISGLGIGVYEYNRNIMENGLLVDIFPNMSSKEIPYYYTYHKRLENSPKVQAFHEFMKDIVKVWERKD